MQFKNKTKIVATVGPACGSVKELSAMMCAGASIFRINGAHGNREEHEKYVELIRRSASECGVTAAILFDLPGPKLRIGVLKKEPVQLKKGEHVILACGMEKQTDARIPVPEISIARSLKKADRIFLNDGTVSLLVENISGDEVSCVVMAGGEIRSKKGLNLPKVKLSIPSITKHDKQLLSEAVKMGVDYVGLSFVRSSDDVAELRGILKKLSPHTRIVSKIEKPEALGDLNAIIAASDAIMIARGDLGIETPFDELPLLQRDIIRRCREAGRPVITATQMLESMVASARPTRAEATDVAVAVWEGTDAVMLSEETSIGINPAIAVEAMAHIAMKAEKDVRLETGIVAKPEASERQAQVIAMAAGIIADELKARAIVTPTRSGRTALFISNMRPKTLIFAPTENETTARAMSLYWGVVPHVMQGFSTVDQMLAQAEKEAFKSGLIAKGDTMVMVSGAHGKKDDITKLIEVRRL